jgi:tetratricopeptide (TPR) repeat protein
MRLRSLLVLGLLLSAPTISTLAQRMGGLDMGGASLRVHVVASDDRPVGQGLRVRLMGAGGGSPAAESYTDNSGEVTFSGIEPGTYHVFVSGEGYQDSATAGIEIDRRQMSETRFVRVRRAKEDEGVVMGSPNNATIDVSLLRAPAKARKEFEKANQLLARQQWAKAAGHLQKAVAIDPKFGAAYNNLAVAYAKLGDVEREREALDKALESNDHNLAALANRARLALNEKDMAGGERYLTRALALDPGNTQMLMVLAKIQLLSRQYDAAVASAQRIHSLPHQKYALVHYLAARALEAEHHLPAAASELRVFLKEEPDGQWTAAARKELGLLEAGSVPVFDTANP